MTSYQDAAMAIAPSPWSWTLSTAIAAAALILVVVAHTSAAFLFFMRWKVSLDLVRQDLDSFKLEIRDDLRKIETTLERMASSHGEIVELRAELGFMRERVRSLESKRRGSEDRGWHEGEEDPGGGARPRRR